MIENMDSKIQLENFYGPLDLLLYLIKEDELNIYDIPIARVTEQYTSYLEMIKKLDINLAGEFIVMVSTLMEIKSKTLMPRDEEEPEEADPRFELVRKLIEYKKYKDLAQKFRPLITEYSQRRSRPVIHVKRTENEEEETLVELDLWTLVRAFSRLSSETTLDISTSILYDDVPVEKFIENIIQRLKKVSQLMFSELVGQKADRFNVLKNLLASLELARQQKVELDQAEDFGDIRLTLRSEGNE
ncbi:MAG: segregation/condensation protein A [Planctomycetes bacterium]|nr:segregation/condensation protein A [Planctomycetota bacterium]